MVIFLPCHEIFIYRVVFSFSVLNYLCLCIGISWSIKETASSSSSSLEGRDTSLQKGSSSYAALPKQVSSYSLSSLFKGRNRLPSLPSLSDAFSDTGVKNYAPELRRPRAEYKDYSNDWSPRDTVRRMQRGKVCSLERFRSLQDKMVLLDEAVAGHDGNFITAVRPAGSI